MYKDKGPISGRYPIKNKQKYIGDPNNVWYRSSWELAFNNWLDKNDNVLEWKSEEIWIPYVSPKDGNIHKYYVDYWIKIKTNNGVKEWLIEIKPYNQVVKPKEPKRKTKQYKEKVLTWLINKQKWESAIKYAEERNMTFKILTERELFGKKK